jgi:hypothetical protein
METLKHLPDHLRRLAMMSTILEACHKSTVCCKLLNQLYKEVNTQSEKEGFKLCTLFPEITPEILKYSDADIDIMRDDEYESVRRQIINE